MTDTAESLKISGTLHRQEGRLKEAMADYRQSLALRPDAEVHNDLANILRQRSDLEEAERHYRAAIALDPTLAEAHNGLGICLKNRMEFEKAEEAYYAAVAANPAFAPAHNNLGIICQDLARLDEAMGHFDKAIEIDPDYIQAHFHRALLKMLLGHWKDGFAEYQWRWRMERFFTPHVAEAWWDGGDLHGKTVLLHAEQGLGDVIQFARYAQVLKDRGGRVLVEAPKSLHRLLAATPGIDELRTKGEPAPAFDFQVPMMSMPLILGETPETLFKPEPYIKAEPALVAKWKKRLGPKRGFRVGISWQGNPAYRADYYRSPPLSAFAPLLHMSGVEVFSLQKGHGVEQLDRLPEGLVVTDLSAELDNGPDAFVDTAAVMENMDLLVMSDTAIVHVAGALGVPVWAPLPHVPDWRFLTDTGETCVWYPTMRLFRQGALNHWESSFRDIAKALEAQLP